MAVVAEIADLKFKFDVHALPALRPDLPFRLAIGEAGPSGCLKIKKAGGISRFLGALFYPNNITENGRPVELIF